MKQLPQFKRELPGVPFKLFDEPLHVLIKFYKEHIRRDFNDGKLRPVECWVALRALLISASQTYASVCILLSEKQPRRLMLQAAILNRSLLETLGNVMALCEAPKSRARILTREAFKNLAIKYQRDRHKHGSDPKWKDYLEMLSKAVVFWAEGFRLSRRYIKNPSLVPEQWPTPGKLIHGDKRRNQPPFLRGNRRAAFQMLYDSHYGYQSEQAHQRAAALSAALIVDEYDQWNPGLGESNLVADALLYMACILSELESKGKYPGHPRLRELWTYLRALNDEAEELWRLRYRALLKA